MTPPTTNGLSYSPETDKPSDYKARQRLFARPTHFMLSVTDLNHLPAPTHPEICFAGRSNVGKSSLINALTGQNGLARASNRPGRTRELNYFNVDTRLYIVDLPGYGYARAQKDAIAHWVNLTRRFLATRACLQRTLLLIDSRHGIKPKDENMMDWLDQIAQPYQIILTKTDCLKTTDLDMCHQHVRDIIHSRPAALSRIHATSSAKKTGIENLRTELAGLALPDYKL